MTEPEFEAALASGKITVQDSAATEPDGGAAAPATPSIDLAQFIPLLMQLQSVQLCVSTAPTYIPQTFQEQIVFVFDGTNYFLYLYFNNKWNKFAVSGGGGSGVDQILAGSGISISPGGGTGIVTINCTITDATLPMSDITTNNVSTSQHGFVPKLPNDATKFLNGAGAFTVPGTGGSSAISTVSGTDNLSGQTAPINTTHTITHGLGVRPKIFSVWISVLAAPVVVGTGHVDTEQSGWIYLDTNGNAIGGMAFTYSHVYGGSGTFTLVGVNLPGNTFTGGSATSGGTGTASITINNITNTTFDIVYTGSISGATQSGTFTYPTVQWTVIG